MSSDLRCPRCGAPLISRDSRPALCPSCLVRAGLGPEADFGGTGAGRLVLPRVFGAYELTDELGRGGMGVVYAAWQPALHRKVAVKLLLAGTYASETAFARFRTEAAAAAALQHPNIVEIHDYGEEEGQPFYVMDLVAGRNLAQVCEGRPLDAARAAAIMRELTDAVHYAHGGGILHRDLKPSNVLVDERGRPRITDFGLARRLDDVSAVTLTGQVLGSPGYVSPEQARGRADAVDVRTDVYGLGAILYHLLTGRAPFSAATPTEALRQLLESDPPAPRLLNPAVPADLETICLKCLAKEPSRRYGSAAEVGEDIGSYLDHRPIRARPPSVGYRTRKFVRRYRVGVMAVAAVVLALAAGLAAALTGYQRAWEQQRAAEAARTQAQRMVTFILEQLRPQLEALGRQEALRGTAQIAVRYFEQLPSELRDARTLRAHAYALQFLAESVDPWGFKFVERDRDERWAAIVRAGRLWNQIAALDQDDGEAAALSLYGRYVDQRALNRPADPADWERAREGFLQRYRELEVRFPNEPLVQLCLVRTLRDRAADGANAPHEKHAQAIADGLEACTRIRRMIEAYPEEPRWRIELTYSLHCAAQAYLGAGRLEDRRCCYEEAMVVADALLREDSTHFRHLNTATAVALILAGCEDSDLRRLPLIRNAKRHVQTLKSMDPAVVEWRAREASLEAMEGKALAALRRITDALEPSRRAVAMNRALAEEGENVQGYGTCLAEAGVIAAHSGDAEAARVHLATLRTAVFSTWARKARSEYDRGWREYATLFWQCTILEAVEDWTGMESMARAMIGLVESQAVLATEDGRARAVLRHCASALLGEALLRQNLLARAHPLLEEGMDVFESDGHPGPVFEQFDLSRRLDVAVNFAEVLCHEGDFSRARAVLHRALDQMEWELGQRAPSATGGWLESRMRLARGVSVLARAWNPEDAAEAASRIELLTCAAAMLDDPEFDPVWWPDQPKLREQLAAALES